MTPGRYLEDAKKMIGFAAPLIKEGMGANEVVQAFQFISNGIEKLLKHGVEKINPLFIQKLPDFKHSAAVYKDKFVPGYAGAEVEKEPDQDVITFKTSLNRLKVFSQVANKHSQLLHTMISWRDVLAHRPSSELDIEAIRRMLLKDVAQLICDFSTEYGLTCDSFFGTYTRRIKTLSDNLVEEDRIRAHMETLLERHRGMWELKKGDLAFVNEADRVTVRESGIAGADFSNETVPCPACGQDAIVRVEPDYDYADGETYLSGVYPESLNCFHCGLELRGYEEFNYVDLDDLLVRNY